LTSKSQTATFLPTRTAIAVEVDNVSDWHLIATHGLVLGCIARDPDITTRQIASLIGVTERTAHKIISDLHNASYLSKQKIGRRNRYEIDTSKPLGHPALHMQKDQENTPSVGDFLEAIGAIHHTQPAGKERLDSARGGFRRIFWRDSKNQREAGVGVHLDASNEIAPQN
jgi:hypothetical protein